MAADLATIQTRIDELDEKLAGGVKSASSGDQRTDYDLAAMREERDRLQRIINNASGTGTSQIKRVTIK